MDSEDRLFVLNRGSHPVAVFDRHGRLAASWGAGQFSSAHGVCIGDDGSVYCTDDGNHTVAKFSDRGEPRMVLGTRDRPSDTGYTRAPGAGMAEQVATIRRAAAPFNRPTGVALSARGALYVSDGYGNARVHRFSPAGTLELSWGEPGTGPGQFRVPHSVRLDRQGRVWVCDRENGRIQIFDADGAFIDQWAELHGNPCDLCFDRSGTVYVSIKSKSLPFAVSIFTPSGALLAHWGSQGPADRVPEQETALFVTPHAIAVDSRGNIYVGEIRHAMARVDRGNRAIRKFARRTAGG